MSVSTRGRHYKYSLFYYKNTHKEKIYKKNKSRPSLSPQCSMLLFIAGTLFSAIIKKNQTKNSDNQFSIVQSTYLLNKIYFY